MMPVSRGIAHRSSGRGSAHRPWLLGLDNAALAVEIERRFGTTLGKLEPLGLRFSYPMRLLLADAYAKDGVVLLADAAHAIHPVAGQGFNLGVRDVAALAEALVDGHRLGLDLGSLAVLENYARWRRFDNLLLTGFTDGLVRLFSNDLPPVRLARDLGFYAFNLAKPLKRFAMRHAMGVVGDCRGWCAGCRCKSGLKAARSLQSMAAIEVLPFSERPCGPISVENDSQLV